MISRFKDNHTGKAGFAVEALVIASSVTDVVTLMA